VPQSLPLPLRVSVKGASTVGWMAPMSGPRTDLGFPRVIERELLRAGQAAVVLSHTVGGDATRNVLRDWERQVVGWSPDVVVLMSGHYETIHLLLPNWLERHANSMTWAPRRIGTLYRKRLLRPLWRSLVKFQGVVDRRLPRLSALRVRHAVADVRRAVEHMRQVGSPLVIVMETPIPAPYAQRLFPGMAERVALLNGWMGEMVAGFESDEVRLFRTTDVVDSFADGDLTAALPDGFHFHPGLHDLVGRRLAEEIGAWAQTQEHLKPPA
jgi:lysophospholipase L1-like esterase